MPQLTEYLLPTNAKNRKTYARWNSCSLHPRRQAVFANKIRWRGQNGTVVFRSYPCLWSYLKGIICSKTARTREELWWLIQAAATTIRQNGTLLEQCRVSGILDVTRLSHALRLPEGIFSKLCQRYEAVMSNLMKVRVKSSACNRPQRPRGGGEV